MSHNPLSGLEGAIVKHIKDPRELTNDIGQHLVELMQSNLQAGDHIFSGTTHNATGYDHESTSVKCLSPWSKVLEYGRRPGSHVPIEPLKKWIMYKRGLSEDEAEAEARKLEQYIFKHGTMPTKFAKISIIQLTNGATPSRVKPPTKKHVSREEKFYKKSKKLNRQVSKGLKRFKKIK